MLGDMIEKALTTVGVTSERVEAWVGGPCNCADRREKLNQLWRWAARVLDGKTEKAEMYLDGIINERKAS